MIFDWSQYLNLAEELASSTDEAKLRSSISRAYYAAFNVAREYLRKLGYPLPKDSSVHIYVIDEFKNAHKENNKNWKIWRFVGSDLGELRLSRNNADYDNTLFNLPKKSQYALKISKGIIEKINNLLKETEQN